MQLFECDYLEDLIWLEECEWLKNLFESIIFNYP